MVIFITPLQLCLFITRLEIFFFHIGPREKNAVVAGHSVLLYDGRIFIRLNFGVHFEYYISFGK